MRKFFTLVAFTAISFFASAQGLVNYEFNGRVGNEEFVATNFVEPGLVASTITRGLGLSAQSKTGTFGSRGITNNKTTIDVTDYIEFSITPSAGFEMKILSLTLNVFSNGTGPTKIIARTSLDNFATDASSPENVTTTATQISLNITDITTKKTVTFRIYPFASGNGGNSEFYIGGISGADLVVEGSAQASTLPVNFISFNAKAEGSTTKLTWNVAEQKDVLHYAIERSSNGNNFTKIGEVAASDVTTYNFIDKQPAQGTVFYRIKNIDVDGKFKYSTIVSIRNGQSAIVLKAFPLPAKNNITLQHATANAQSIIRLSAQDGRTMKTIRPAAGTMQTGIDISAFAPGLYLLSFDNGNGLVETLKLVKQ